MQEDYIKIDTEWSMQGYIYISRKMLEDAGREFTVTNAMIYAKENLDEFDIPAGEYLEDSLNVFEDINLQFELDPDILEK